MKDKILEHVLIANSKKKNIYIISTKYTATVNASKLSDVKTRYLP